MTDAIDSVGILPDRSDGPFRNRTKQGPRDITALTGLRFYAALAVMIYHFWSNGGEPTPTSTFAIELWRLLPFLRNAHLMVDFFFILSGFVLTHVYQAQIESRDFKVKDFYVRRIARIYPLHLTTFAFMLFCTSVFISLKPDCLVRMPSLWDCFAQLSMTHAWGIAQELSLNRPSWSISAEWFAYLFFPSLAKLLLSSNKWLGLIMVVAWFILLFRISIFLGTDLTQRTADFGILRVAAEFPLGVSAYRFYRDSATLIAPWLVFALLGVVLMSMCFDDLTLLSILLMVAVTLAAATSEREHHALPVLSSRVSILGGLVSYSIYMLHVPVINTANGAFDFIGISDASWMRDLLRLVCCCLVLGLSMLSYRIVELRGRRFVLDMLARIGAK